MRIKSFDSEGKTIWLYPNDGRPKGAQVYFNGSWYKISRNLAWRYCSATKEWVISNVAVAVIEREIAAIVYRTSKSRAVQ